MIRLLHEMIDTQNAGAPTKSVTRRVFLKLVAGTAAGLGIGSFVLPEIGKGLTPQPGGRLNLWVLLTPDDQVTIRVPCVDMGQGSQTGLAQILADEMDADWSKVRVEMAPLTGEYLDKDGEYYTGGSQSIRFHWEAFAKAGAAARAMLLTAAAEQWGVAQASLRASNGAVIHEASGRSTRYGALAEHAAKLPLPADIVLKKPGARVLIGRPVAQIGQVDKVNGAAVYGIDMRLPGMLSATLLQCPHFGGALTRVDEAPALRVRGVVRVLKFSDAVIVVANDFWSARQGVRALSPVWSSPDGAIVSNADLYTKLREQVGAADSTVSALDKDTGRAVQRVDAALKSGAKVVEAEYEMPLLAHCAMEPMNALARVTDTRCELWAPMQAQSDMRDALAKELGLPRDAVELHTTTIGGGFGRRLKVDYGVLAARVAKIMRQPVQLLWTREEDMTHDFYRPATVGRVRAALDKDAMIMALDYTGATTNDTASGGLARNYPLKDVVVRQKSVRFDLPVGSWRSVDPSITAFLIESFVDEIAHAHGLDPVAYRRRLLAGDARGLRTLDAAAELANWGSAPAGRHQGIAFFGSNYWGTSIAEVVELSVDTNSRITLHKVFCALDPGIAINPQLIRAQVEGGIILGLSAALAEEITIANGAVQQKNFDSYKPMRFASAPNIEVRILESPDVPIGGIGEPPVPPAAPALANAIFAATGKRIRKLPLGASGFSV
jgi:isoquinoline 1-oxidoreductase beta subunit